HRERRALQRRWTCRWEGGGGRARREEQRSAQEPTHRYEVTQSPSTVSEKKKATQGVDDLFVERRTHQRRDVRTFGDTAFCTFGAPAALPSSSGADLAHERAAVDARAVAAHREDRDRAFVAGAEHRDDTGVLRQLAADEPDQIAIAVEHRDDPLLLTR